MVSVKKNAALNTLKTLMSLIFPLITFPYVSHILGPDGTGKVHYAQSIVSYFSMIAMLGINTYGLREAAKIRDDKDKLSKFYKEMFLITLTSTFIAYVLFFAALFCFRSLDGYKNILLVTSGSILFTTLGVEWLYGAVEDYKYITVRSAVFQIIGLALLFAFVKDKDDYLQYASLSVITNVGSNLLNCFHCHKYVYVLKRYNLEIKKHLKPVFILFGTSVAISIYTVLDSTMLGILCDDKDVGLYNAATKITKIVMSLVVSIGAVATPRMAHIIEFDEENYKNLLLKICNLYLFLTIPCTVGLCFLAKPIIFLFCGNEFNGAIVTMQIMTPIILFISFGQFFSNLIFTPMRKDNYSLFPVLIGAAVNFCLNLVLIPKFRALGAGMASVFAECTVCSIKFFLTRKLSFNVNIKGMFTYLHQYLIAALVMALVLLPGFFLTISFLAKLIVSVVLGTFFYIAVLTLFKNEYVLNFFAAVKRRLCHART